MSRCEERPHDPSAWTMLDVGICLFLSAELLARTSQANMADHMKRHRVRWLRHTARKPNDVMIITWMDTAMHDMGSLGHTLQIDLPRDWVNLALYRDVLCGGVSWC